MLCTRARAAGRIAERHLVQPSLARTPSVTQGWVTSKMSIPTTSPPRKLSTSIITASGRMGRGSRFTVSRDHRRPLKSHHASDQTPQSAPSHPLPPSQPSISEALHNSNNRITPAQNPALAHTTTSPPTDPSINVAAVVPNDPHGILQAHEWSFQGATNLLSQSALIVTREIEMINIFLGFEQANKYSIHSPDGTLVGYLAEEEQGLLGGALQRQVLRTHRPFRATVMDVSGKPVLMIKRPFTWINSTAHIYAVRSDYPVGYGAPQDHDLELIGEVQQRWHLFKRKYELFLRRKGKEGGQGGMGEAFEQFAQIDGGFLTWTFLMQDAENKLVGAIDRNFRGFGREIFTDTGQYVLRFDSVGETAMTNARLSSSLNDGLDKEEKPKDLAEGMEMVKSHGTRPLTLDERAVALATAVSIDFDYFSRHSEGMHGGGGMFPWFYMGGMGGGGGGEAEASQGIGNNDNVPANTGGGSGGGDGGFGTGVAGGAIGSGMDYPYGPSDSGMSEDGRLAGQPPPNPNGLENQTPQNETPWWGQDQQQPRPQQGAGMEGDVWGEGNNDPWAGAQDTQQPDEGFWGGWGGGGGHDSDGGGSGWGGFFGGGGDGASDW